MFDEHVVPGSIIVTDGYLTYPGAVAKFGSRHGVVNHSVGFVNAQGAHTNQIENLCHILSMTIENVEVLIKGELIFFK